MRTRLLRVDFTEKTGDQAGQTVPENLHPDGGTIKESWRASTRSRMCLTGFQKTI